MCVDDEAEAKQGVSAPASKKQGQTAREASSAHASVAETSEKDDVGMDERREEPAAKRTKHNETRSSSTRDVAAAPARAGSMSPVGTKSLVAKKKLTFTEPPKSTLERRTTRSTSRSMQSPEKTVEVLTDNADRVDASSKNSTGRKHPGSSPGKALAASTSPVSPVPCNPTGKDAPVKRHTRSTAQSEQSPANGTRHSSARSNQVTSRNFDGLAPDVDTVDDLDQHLFAAAAKSGGSQRPSTHSASNSSPARQTTEGKKSLAMYNEDHGDAALSLKPSKMSFY